MVTDNDSPNRAGRVLSPFYSSGVGHPAKELKEQWHSLAGESREDKSGLVNCANPSGARSLLHPGCCPTSRGAPGPSCSLGPLGAAPPPSFLTTPAD